MKINHFNLFSNNNFPKKAQKLECADEVKGGGSS